jgi:hypothetical protein
LVTWYPSHTKFLTAGSILLFKMSTAHLDLISPDALFNRPSTWGWCVC